MSELTFRPYTICLFFDFYEGYSALSKPNTVEYAFNDKRNSHPTIIAGELLEFFNSSLKAEKDCLIRVGKTCLLVCRTKVGTDLPYRRSLIKIFLSDVGS
jgi:hypothetical protein